MYFNSIVFLLYFLPFFLLLYFLTAKYQILRLSLLIFVGIVFYCWSVGDGILVLLLSALWCFIIARLMGVYKKKKKYILFLGIGMLVLLLGYYKYNPSVLKTDFVISLLEKSSVLSEILKPRALLLGISFFTFSGISYLVDEYRKPQKAKLIPFLAYFTFFPKILQGPITRWSEVSKEFMKPKISFPSIFDGFTRFFFGLFKKVVIADSVAKVTNGIFALAPSDQTFLSAWIGILCFTIQIYFDFSGYTDMALGLSRILGITLSENFNKPYLSSSVTQFWNRWHISLSTFLRDYVYIPLGGNRKGYRRTLVNIGIVFVISGLWHGTGLQYLLWGVYHGFWVIIERIFSIPLKKVSSYVKIPLTFIIIMIGWVFFRAPTWKYAIKYLFALIPHTLDVSYPVRVSMLLDASKISMILAGLVFIFVIEASSRSVPKKLVPLYLSIKGIAGICAFIYAISIIATSTFTPFLYFQY